MEEERPTREFVLQLMGSKEAMETELRELLSVLQTNNTDMTQPLVDNEGFPRADIDVYQVRLARHRIICLRNDLKNLTERIESALHSIHAQQRESMGVSERSSLLEEFSSDATPPFAKIGTVTEGSPAARAGLKSEDLVLAFGTLRAGNFTGLQDVAQIVQHSVDREILVCVRRNERLFPLSLVPKVWSGKGLLGCVLLPIDNVDR